METALEKLIIYGITALLCAGVVWLYLHKKSRESKKLLKRNSERLTKKAFMNLFPSTVCRSNKCIQTGACIKGLSQDARTG